MHFTSIILGVASIMPGVLSCQQGYEIYCSWSGDAPSCGTSSANIGDRDSSGAYLYETTRDNDINTLYKRGYITAGCYQEYGASCWSGYKRLWCKKSSYAQSIDEEEEVHHIPYHSYDDDFESHEDRERIWESRHGRISGQGYRGNGKHEKVVIELN